MKSHTAIICAAMSAMALAVLQVGCDRQVSNKKSSSVSSDGTVKTEEKTVTQSKDGSTVTKTLESKTTAPSKP